MYTFNLLFPKLYMNPNKASFIIAPPKCCLKPLPKFITSSFKPFCKQIESFNKQGFLFSGIKSLSTILKNHPVINSIKNLVTVVATSIS